MADQKPKQTALGDVAARQLAIATRTVPQLSRITPRWLPQLLFTRRARTAFNIC